MKTILLTFLIFPVVFIGDRLSVGDARLYGECTIGVFSAGSTADGRPMLWKNRDVTGAVQKFCYYQRPDDTDRGYSFTGNCYSNDTTRVYMGLNEAGFAVINSNSYNLHDSLSLGLDDGVLLRMALQSCRTLADLEDLLDRTAVKGRKDCWNIGAFDADGNAALYECGNRTYVKYDANNPDDAPDGIILRATFGLSGTEEDRIGLERYKRVCRLVYGERNDVPIDARFVLQTLARDLSSPIADVYPLPYNGRQNMRPPGFINTEGITINRDVSRSVMVIRGTRPNEDVRLGTIFSIIGPPVLGVAFPLWVEAREVPYVLNTGTETPMYSLMALHRANLYPNTKDPDYLDSHYLLDNDGQGIYRYTLPLEDEILLAADNFVDTWNEDFPSYRDFATAQSNLADYIYEQYLDIPRNITGVDVPEEKSLPGIANYPNPFNPSTTIHLSGFADDLSVNVGIYDMLGRLVKSLNADGGDSRFVIWDGTDNRNDAVASGVYLIVASNSEYSTSTKAVLMR